MTLALLNFAMILCSESVSASYIKKESITGREIEIWTRTSCSYVQVSMVKILYLDFTMCPSCNQLIWTHSMCNPNRGKVWQRIKEHKIAHRAFGTLKKQEIYLSVRRI